MEWRTFRLDDEKQRWLYTDETKAIVLHEKDFFNKNTDYVAIYKGFETEEYSMKPISNEIYFINIGYSIKNYFGDTSGIHFRNKDYIFKNGVLYKLERYGNPSTVVKRITKELKGVLAEIEFREESVRDKIAKNNMMELLKGMRG